MACNAGPDIIEDGLVLCLDAANINSYPRTGTTWTDLKGNYNGTLTNMDASNFNSSNSGGFDFDGTDEQIDFSAIDSNLFSNGEASLFTFFKAHSPSVDRTPWGFGSELRSHYIWTDGNCYFNTFRSTRLAFPASSTVERDKPHIVCITTKNGGSWKFYQNLELVYTTTAQSSINLTDPIIARGDLSYNWHGTFYNFMIYNKELSFGEIRQNYEATVGRFT
jgi:hypothetical protein